MLKHLHPLKNLKAKITSLTLLILLAGAFTAPHVARSQQAAAFKFDVGARTQDLLAHLNAVIRFYRSSTSPVQTAGEPNDIVYRDQAIVLSTQVTQYAFQSAKAEASLMAEYQRHEGVKPSATGPAEQQRLQSFIANVEQQMTDIKAQEAALDRKIAKARPKDLAALQAQRKDLEGSLDLTNAMKDALQKTISMTEAQASTGLGGDIDSLKRSLPLLDSKTPPVGASLASLDQVRSSGVSSQTMALFQLLSTEHSLDTLAHDNEALHKQALDLRAPIIALLRSLIVQGKQLSQQTTQQVTQQTMQHAAKATAPTAATTSITAANMASNAKQLESITTTFKAVSSASVPLSQEIIILEQSQANLAAWRSAVDREYKNILQALLLRLLIIAIALAIIFAAGELWTRAANRYIHDPRRRRQILLLRRTAVGLLSAVVLLFGFITQFNSLATFAGFITAGIAVGLQTILLSVAAYFFIIGRYGIKVGDRITIQAVTGEVIEVGLVRFYIMELAGSGTELKPSGRVAVFSNAVLFQAAAPIFKQIPGTEYAWHELIVKLSDQSNYKQASEAILHRVHDVYETYRTAIEAQHRSVEQWMHTSIVPPSIESRLQFDSGTLQLWARFPVQISHADETDEELTQSLLQLLEENPEIKEAVTALPVLRPSVKG